MDGQAGITNDTAHGQCINWVMAWDGKNASTVRHDGVFSLAQDSESCFFKRSNCFLMINSREFPHRLTCHLDFAHFGTLRQIVHSG